VVDLDGVIWLAGEPIRGSAEALARLRSAGIRVVFATNNAGLARAGLLGMLQAVGISTAPEDLVTSADAAAALLGPSDRVVLCAGAGVREALVRVGAQVVDEGPADAVVVGFTRDVTFEMISVASSAARAGARLIATNADPTYPTPSGLIPGAGAILAAVATASGAEPIVAGKPNQPMARLLQETSGEISMVVGDRTTTDGRLAQALGVPFALVRTGVTPPGAAAPPPEPSLDAPDLAALVDLALGGTPD
jgi:4-nitrophenyl phosphatase